MIKTLRGLDYNRELIELLLLDKIGAIALYLAMPVAYFVLFQNIVPLHMLFALLFAQIFMYIVRTNITRDFLEVLFSYDSILSLPVDINEPAEDFALVSLILV